MASKITFDGINKLMHVNDGVTDLNVKEDIYSDWKEWTLIGDNAKYKEAIEAIGGQPTTGNSSLDATFFLINGWKIKPYSGQYDLVIDGNIFDANGEDIKVPADISDGEPNNITITRNTSVTVRAVDVNTELEQEQAIQLEELWKIHGLQSGSKLTVNGTERKAGNVSQSIDYNESTNTTIVERQ